MFGIEDRGIWSAYLLALLCLIFSIYWGLTRWNKDYDSDKPEDEIINEDNESALKSNNQKK